jgi:hypothetical protein
MPLSTCPGERRTLRFPSSAAHSSRRRFTLPWASMQMRRELSSPLLLLLNELCALALLLHRCIQGTCRRPPRAAGARAGTNSLTLIRVSAELV